MPIVHCVKVKNGSNLVRLFFRQNMNHEHWGGLVMLFSPANQGTTVPCPQYCRSPPLVRSLTLGRVNLISTVWCIYSCGKQGGKGTEERNKQLFEQKSDTSCLLQSLSLAPRTFTKYVEAALALLRPTGVHILAYLDNWALVASSKERAAA